MKIKSSFNIFQKSICDTAETITSALTMELKGLLFLSSILLLNHTYYAQDCCQKKIVSEPAEYVGSYTFGKKFDGAKDDNCADSCIYRKDTGPPEDQYCFKEVNTKHKQALRSSCELLRLEGSHKLS